MMVVKKSLQMNTSSCLRILATLLWKRESMKKVLLVEDEPNLREGLARTLVNAGYLVVDAADGVEALEKTFREHPDIIVLDMVMPVMDRIQVLIRLRKNPETEAIPVILVSGLQENLRAGEAFANTRLMKKP